MQRKLRVIVVGCGGMSRAWLSAARDIDGLEVVGLVDVVEAAAAERAVQFGLQGAAIGTDVVDILQRVQPDIVFDVTVPEAHVGVTRTALAHGCHVLGEKPMAASLEDARSMVEAAQQAGKIYAVIQNRRYDPNIRRFQAFLRSGGVGTLTTLHSDFYVGAHFGGFRDHMRHVLLLDMAIHTFDAARLLSGTDPVAVYCKEWNPAGSWYDYDASAVAIFEMSNGLIYTYRGSWCAEGLNTTWEASWRADGDRGSATWDGASQFQAAIVKERGTFISPTDAVELPPIDAGGKVGGHAGLLREFVHCIETGATPETVCTDNIKSLAMVFGAIESAETGRRVAIRW